MGVALTIVYNTVLAYLLILQQGPSFYLSFSLTFIYLLVCLSQAQATICLTDVYSSAQWMVQ